MEASIGKALREARLKKNLTLEEASEATKIHADRLGELERDEYSRFPSLAYARNFLMLYARYLGVDAAQYPLLDIGKPVFTADYQYLQGETLGSIRWTGPRRRKPIRPSRWLLALGILAAAITIGALTAFIILDFLRLPNVDTLLSKGGTPESAEVAAPPSPSPAPSPAPAAAAVETEPPREAEAPVSTPETSPESSDEVWLSPEAAPATPLVPEPSAAEAPPGEAAPSPTTDTAAAMPPAMETTEASAPAATPSPTPVVDTPEREIKVRVTRRTKVKITKDVAGSEPVFNGFLEPGKPPLTLRGKHFWIDTPNPGSIKVTSDGKPVEAPGRSGTSNRSLQFND